MQKDPLDPLLDRWDRLPPIPANLKTEVWRHIAVAELEEEKEGFWQALEAIFRRPSFACVFMATCLLTGLLLAEVRLSRIHAERSAHYARTYLRLIDPLLTDSEALAQDSTKGPDRS